MKENGKAVQMSKIERFGYAQWYVDEALDWSREITQDLEGRRLLVDDRPDVPPSVLANPEVSCPPGLVRDQKVLEPTYFGFDGEYHIGRIEIHQEAAADVEAMFAFLLKEKVPIQKVVPASSKNWDDDVLMDANLSSGFNYRPIAGRTVLSAHSLGLAVDINPRILPYVRRERGQTIVSPSGASYDPNAPGAITDSSEVVLFMRNRGWEWGGDWTLDQHGIVDYQHFELKLSPVSEGALLARYGLSATAVGVRSTR